MNRMSPGSRLVVLAGGSHRAPLEHPPILDEIVRFLEGSGPGRARAGLSTRTGGQVTVGAQSVRATLTGALGRASDATGRPPQTFESKVFSWHAGMRAGEM
jgi:hypothetical protein